MNSIKCPKCNLTNWATAIKCKRCEYVFFSAQMEPGDSVQPEEPRTYVDPERRQISLAYGQTQLKSGLAIASMVLGIVGFAGGCFGGFLLAPVGLVLGIVALVRSSKRPSEYGGQGFAIAGIVLSAMGVLFFPIIAAIAIPNLLASRRAANEGSAISSIRTLTSAELTYMSTSGAGECGDLS